MGNRVVLRVFNYRSEGEIVRELLEAAGIEAEVTSDDCGMVDPALQFVRGALLWVDEDDRERALQIIAAGMAADGVAAEAEYDEKPDTST